MCDYWDISDSTPITFTGLKLEYVSKRRGELPRDVIGMHYPELTDLGSTCYCILNNSEEYDFWTALMRLLIMVSLKISLSIHSGIVLFVITVIGRVRW
nr:MAG TPA: hypothetical protein [Caudoviricetes sp.]